MNAERKVEDSIERRLYPDYLSQYVDQDILDSLGTQLPPRTDRNLLIAGGGLDLTGKTTSLINLSEATGATYVYCMDGNPLAKMRKLFDNSPTIMRYLYFVSISLFNYQRIEDLRIHGNVLLDQSIYATVAYHLAYGLNPKLLKLIPPRFVNRIDALLFFTVPREVRLERLGKRRQENTSQVTRADEKSFEIDEQVERNYLGIRPEITEVVTTHDQSEAQVVETILGVLQI